MFSFQFSFFCSRLRICKSSLNRLHWNANWLHHQFQYLLRQHHCIIIKRARFWHTNSISKRYHLVHKFMGEFCFDLSVQFCIYLSNVKVEKRNVYLNWKVLCSHVKKRTLTFPLINMVEKLKYHLCGSKRNFACLITFFLINCLLEFQNALVWIQSGMHTDVRPCSKIVYMQ